MPRVDQSVPRALAAVADAPGIVTGLRSSDALTAAAATTSAPDDALARLTVAIDDDQDQLTSIAAIHAVSALTGAGAGGLLIDLLADRRWHVSEHAAWALSARLPEPAALVPLLDLVASGGFTGMLAQRTLEGWSATAGPAVTNAAVATLDAESRPGPRRRLTETLGLVERMPTDPLERIAGDGSEAGPVRIAAVAALGDRRGDPRPLIALAGGDDGGGVADHALLALADRLSRDEVGSRSSPGGGLRIAQLFLHADADDDRAGAGDSGGIATLLRLLSQELAARPEVGEIMTIGRGDVASAIADHWPSGDRAEHFVGVPFGPPGGVDAQGAWMYRVQVERGLRRLLRDGVDALHLRMADVGTLAAARVARHQRVPIVFTAAPDPHVVVRALEEDGALGRADFGDADVLAHLWFRARMVERLLDQAERIAVLPRDDVEGDLRDLLGFDLDANRWRAVVVPEGVHAATVRRADRDVRAATAEQLPAGVDRLATELTALPVGRRSLPLIVSVGRLHPSKGMGRLVEAWVSTPALRSATNLVIVGGSLSTPSPDELDVLSSIDDLVNGRPGVILLGNLPHGDVARVLRATAIGAPGVPAGGVYVGAARKEEFGLAIVEALAAGLPVVAPTGGGPSTYVRDGVTGVLADTSSAAALATSIERAIALVADPGRVELARRDVLDRLTIENMADRLVELYGSIAHVVAS